MVLLGVFLLVADPPRESPGRAANAGMTDLPSSEDRARRDGTDRCSRQEAADSAPARSPGVLALVFPADRNGASGSADRQCSEEAGTARDGDR